MMAALVSRAAIVDRMGHIVTIHPDGGQAKVIRLEVVNDRIIRVRATSKDDLPQKMQSLMIVPQQAPAKNSYTITETPESIEVIAKQVRAVVSKAKVRCVSMMAWERHSC